MNKYKYKYFMNGMIDGTDGKTYNDKKILRLNIFLEYIFRDAL